MTKDPKLDIFSSSMKRLQLPEEEVLKPVQEVKRIEELSACLGVGINVRLSTCCLLKMASVTIIN